MSKKKIALLLGIVVVAGVGAFALLAPKKDEPVINEPQQTVEVVVDTEEEPKVEVEVPDIITKTDQTVSGGDAVVEDNFTWVDEPCTGERIKYVMVEDTVLLSEPREEGAEVYTVEAGTIFYFDAIAKTENGEHLGYGLLVIDENTKGYFPELAAEMYFEPVEQEQEVVEAQEQTQEQEKTQAESGVSTETQTEVAETTPSKPDTTPSTTPSTTNPIVDPLQELIDSGLLNEWTNGEDTPPGDLMTPEEIEESNREIQEFREEHNITYQ